MSKNKLTKKSDLWLVEVEAGWGELGGGSQRVQTSSNKINKNVMYNMTNTIKTGLLYMTVVQRINQ